MKNGYIVLLLFISFAIGSCGSSNYPCPTLSTTGGESKGILVKKNVAVSKNGLIRKKNVKRLRSR